VWHASEAASAEDSVKEKSEQEEKDEKAQAVAEMLDFIREAVACYADYLRSRQAPVELTWPAGEEGKERTIH